MKTNKIIITLVVVLSIAFLMSGPSFAKNDKELDEIKYAIKKHGAKWVADETSVTKMDPEDRKNLVMSVDPEEFESIEPDSEGFYPFEADAFEADRVESEAIESEAPSSALNLNALKSTSVVKILYKLDWRNKGGNWVTPVRNQGQCGSCWAFATAASLESLRIRALNLSGYNLDLSEQILVSCSGCGSCSGGYPSCASNFILNTGLPLESCSRYTATNGVCATGCLGSTITRYRIAGWSWVTGSAPTVSALKNALMSGPISVCMDVYQDFDSYRSGVYSYVWGAKRGAHAILLIGFDELNKCFIAKNSWGTSWGMSGYFNIAYSQVTNLIKFGNYAIAYR
jgi:C1A family cysteine protease